MALRDTLSQIMAPLRSFDILAPYKLAYYYYYYYYYKSSSETGSYCKITRKTAGRSSDEGTKLDLGQLTLPVNTEDELEQLAQILNDRAMRRRLVSAVYWYTNVVLVDSILQLTSSCVRSLYIPSRLQ